MLRLINVFGMFSYQVFLETEGDGFSHSGEVIQKERWMLAYERNL